MAKTILICDDDPAILEVTSVVLQDQGYIVMALPSSADILKTIQAARPDVVLLDLWMPEVSGEDITKKLKAKKATKSIPVIIVSASRDTQKIAMLAGADDFLCKPFSITELEEKVSQFVDS